MAFLIGISGGSASGKTTFIEKIRETFDEPLLTILSQDHYYKPLHLQIKDEKGDINYDEPESIDLEQFYKDVEELENGNELIIEEYVFNNLGKIPEKIKIKPSGIIIVEGLFIFGHEPIESKLDLKLFIDADEEIKFNRRLIRDKEERGMNEEEIHYQWHNQVVPSYKKHLLPHKEKADILIQNNLNFEDGFVLVIEKIKEILNSTNIEIRNF